MTIAVLRLMSGEEVICTVTDENEDGFFIVDNPHAIHTQMGQGGNVQFGFFPFMMYASGHQVKIMGTAVSCIAIPDEKMEQAYKQHVDPKALIVPEKPSLIVP